jgi:hypothetical protein
MPQVADLNDYRRQREADGRAMQVHVEREVDPECANRSRYLIISRNREAVQTVINGLIAEVESFGTGYGHFDGPYRWNGLFFATGNVVVHPDHYEGPPDV